MPDQLFQKVNFLRDISNTINHSHRIYYTILRAYQLSWQKIIQDFDADLRVVLEGINLLPINSKNEVYEACLYNGKTRTKIKRTSVAELLEKRTRIPKRVETLAFLITSQLNFLWHRTQENYGLCHSI